MNENANFRELKDYKCENNYSIKLGKRNRNSFQSSGDFETEFLQAKSTQINSLDEN